MYQFMSQTIANVVKLSLAQQDIGLVGKNTGFEANFTCTATSF